MRSPPMRFALAQLPGRARGHVAIARQETLHPLRGGEDPQPQPVRLDEERSHEPPHECRGLVPTFTGFSDYPEKLPDEAIGCMTSAQYQCGLTFLRGKTLVATTHMLLLMYKLLLSPGRECLSTIVLSIAEGTSIWLPCSYRRQGRPLARKASRERETFLARVTAVRLSPAGAFIPPLVETQGLPEGDGCESDAAVLFFPRGGCRHL